MLFTCRFEQCLLKELKIAVAKKSLKNSEAEAGHSSRKEKKENEKSGTWHGRPCQLTRRVSGSAKEVSKFGFPGA